MRYLKNVVAWHDATESLLRNRQLNQHHSRLTIHIMTTPSPPFPREMADVSSVFFAAAKKLEEDDLGEDRKAYNAWLKMIGTTFSSTRSFNGTVHCEASLMAAILNPHANPVTLEVARVLPVSISLAYFVITITQSNWII